MSKTTSKYDQLLKSIWTPIMSMAPIDIIGDSEYDLGVMGNLNGAVQYIVIPNYMYSNIIVVII